MLRQMKIYRSSKGAVGACDLRTRSYRRRGTKSLYLSLAWMVRSVVRPSCSRPSICLYAAKHWVLFFKLISRVSNAWMDADRVKLTSDQSVYTPCHISGMNLMTSWNRK